MCLPDIIASSANSSTYYLIFAGDGCDSGSGEPYGYESIPFTISEQGVSPNTNIHHRCILILIIY